MTIYKTEQGLRKNLHDARYNFFCNQFFTLSEIKLTLFSSVFAQKLEIALFELYLPSVLPNKNNAYQHFTILSEFLLPFYYRSIAVNRELTVSFPLPNLHDVRFYKCKCFNQGVLDFIPHFNLYLCI